MSFDREMAEKGGDLFFAHLIGMALLMEENKTTNPVEVDLLRSQRVMFDSEMPTNTIEKLGRGRRGREFWGEHYLLGYVGAQNFGKQKLASGALRRRSACARSALRLTDRGHW